MKPILMPDGVVIYMGVTYSKREWALRKKNKYLKLKIYDYKRD